MSSPIRICDVAIKKLFGLISLNLVIEDRRPDLCGDDERFKSMITIEVFGREWISLQSSSIIRVYGVDHAMDAVDDYLTKNGEKDPSVNMVVDT